MIGLRNAGGRQRMIRGVETGEVEPQRPTGPADGRCDARTDHLGAREVGPAGTL